MCVNTSSIMLSPGKRLSFSYVVLVNDGIDDGCRCKGWRLE